MRLEGSDGALRGAAAMGIGGNQFKLGYPLLSYHPFVVGSGFIVDELEIHVVNFVFKTTHNIFVGHNAVLVLERPEGVH